VAGGGWRVAGTLRRLLLLTPIAPPSGLSLRGLLLFSQPALDRSVRRAGGPPAPRDHRGSVQPRDDAPPCLEPVLQLRALCRGDHADLSAEHCLDPRDHRRRARELLQITEELNSGVRGVHVLAPRTAAPREPPAERPRRKDEPTRCCELVVDVARHASILPPLVSVRRPCTGVDRSPSSRAPRSDWIVRPGALSRCSLGAFSVLLRARLRAPASSRPEAVASGSYGHSRHRG